MLSNKIIAALLFLTALLLTIQVSFSYPLTSTNYEVRSGAFSAGQNLTSSGGNYRIDFSFHEPITGNMSHGDSLIYLGFTHTLNTEPNASSVLLLPAAAKTDEWLNCTFNITDEDGSDVLSANITFWKGGATNSTNNKSVTNSVPDSDNATIGIQSKGETWTCTVQGHDGIVYGNESNSSVTIVNSKPSLYEPGWDGNTLLLAHYDAGYYGTQAEIGTHSGTELEEGFVYDAVKVDSTDTLTYQTSGNLDGTAGTVEMWLMPAWDGEDGQNRIFFDVAEKSNQNRVQIGKNARDMIECRVWDDDKNSMLVGTDPSVLRNHWKAGQWHHIACTWDSSASEAKLYIDGVLIKTYIKKWWKKVWSWGPMSISGMGDMHIGSDYHEENQANAKIDELRISDTARTSFKAPGALVPANGTYLTTNTSIYFNWTAATDRDGDSVTYNLVVDNDEDFSSPSINVTGISETGYIYDGTNMLNDATYWWKVIPNDTADSGDRSNETLYFIVDAVPPVIWNSSFSYTTNESCCPPCMGCGGGTCCCGDVHCTDYVVFSAFINGGQDIDTIWYGGTWEDGEWHNYSTDVMDTGNHCYKVTIGAGNFSNQEYVEFRFYANDSFGNEQAGFVVNFTVQNRPPGISNQSSPLNSSVHTSSPVTLQWESITDPDASCGSGTGHEFNYLVYGSSDCQNVSNSDDSNLLYNGTGMSYDWSISAKNDYWWKIVTDDGLDENESGIYVFTFNNPPNVTHINISSDDSLNRTRGNLTGNYTFYDVDAGDTEQDREIIWYRNGTQEPTAENQIYLSHTNTSKDEEWVFSVRLNDGDSWGSWYNSTPFTINNTAPSVASAELTPTTAYTNTDFTCIGSGYSDDDGDPLSHYFLFQDTGGTLRDWAQNNTFLCNDPGCDKGDVISCKYKAFDGRSNSTAVISNTVTILNTNPVVHEPNTYDSNGVETKYFVWRESVSIKVNITDLDGASDISSVKIMITDSASQLQVDNASMTQGDSITNGNTYTYSYYIPANAKEGIWNVTVYAADAGGASDNDETYFRVGAFHTITVKLELNDTHSSAYVSNIGEANASTLGAGAAYTGLEHWYAASYYGNMVAALVADGANEINASNTSKTHTIAMEQNLTGSMMYLAVTKGNWETIDKRISLIDSGDFMLSIAPSFGFGLGLYHPIMMVLNCTDIDLQGDLIIRYGLYRIEIESQKTGSQKAVYIREISE